jgi:hypothetical protein
MLDGKAGPPLRSLFKGLKNCGSHAISVEFDA